MLPEKEHVPGEDTRKTAAPEKERSYENDGCKIVQRKFGTKGKEQQNLGTGTSAERTLHQPGPSGGGVSIENLGGRPSNPLLPNHIL